MVPIRLAWVSEQCGGPAYALAPAPFAVANEMPTPASVLMVRAPQGAAVLRMPDREASLEWETWVDRLLSEALDLAPADLWMLGPDRDDLARRLLQLWGWLEPGDEALTASAQAMLATLAERLGTMPTELLERYSLPELGATFRLLTGAAAIAADVYREADIKSRARVI